MKSRCPTKARPLQRRPRKGGESCCNGRTSTYGSSFPCDADQGACSGGKCTGGTTPPPSPKTCGGNPAGGSTLTYNIGVLEPSSRCALGVVHPVANSLAEAERCVSVAYPGKEVISSGQSAIDYPYAQRHRDGTCANLQIPAFSSADAAVCAHYQCDTCDNTPGTCSP